MRQAVRGVEVGGLGSGLGNLAAKKGFQKPLRGRLADPGEFAGSVGGHIIGMLETHDLPFSQTFDEHALGLVTGSKVPRDASEETVRAGGLSLRGENPIGGRDWPRSGCR